jgi:hypothetical protein
MFLARRQHFSLFPIEQASKLAARALRRQIHEAADPQFTGQSLA